jgi:hypothetical protein
MYFSNKLEWRNIIRPLLIPNKEPVNNLLEYLILPSEKRTSSLIWPDLRSKETVEVTHADSEQLV